MLQDPPPTALLADLLDGGLKWSITVWGETAKLDRARDEAIAAVRDAIAKNGINGPSPVTTIRLLDRPA